MAAHGGLVNKFEGDAALCIFGAPLALEDPAANALRAAREMAQRLKDEVPDLDAGIGVSQGLVIAGNIGATQRLEYTVIGDPVNEAARLTEQAKEHPGRVVASQRIVDRAESGERDRWTAARTVAAARAAGADDPRGAALSVSRRGGRRGGRRAGAWGVGDGDGEGDGVVRLGRGLRRHDWSSRADDRLDVVGDGLGDGEAAVVGSGLGVGDGSGVSLMPTDGCGGVGAGDAGKGRDR